MQCPLCGGPLHLEDSLVFACERKHYLDAEQMRVAAGTRVTAALWLAIEALETEALALRTLAAGDGADGSVLAVADSAEEDARLLRKIATVHVPPAHGPGAADATV